MRFEKRGPAAVAYLTGVSHRYYEDRYRMLPKDVPLVAKHQRGELFAVFDGIGGAPKGREAAQEMSNCLEKFFQFDKEYPNSAEGVYLLLMNTNLQIFNWGEIPGTQIPLGGCAGTIAWVYQEKLSIFHAGDTVALLIRDGEAQVLTRLHEVKKVMFRYFGLGPTLEMDVIVKPLEPSDRILLLTDGVTKVYHPLEAAAIVEQHDDICRAVSDLVRRARGRGSPDDITAMLIEMVD